MKKPFLKYVGDQKIRDLLEHYACPVPFHAVRTRFLGNIATLRLDASPVEAVKGFWGGELPEFDNLDDVNALLQDLMSLWNALAIHQSRSKPFRLSRGTTGSNSNDLQRFCRTRTEEFEGFMDGLFGAEEAVDLPERAVEGMEELGNINAMFHAAHDLANRNPVDSASSNDLSATFRNLKKLERAAEKEIHAVVLSCKKARAQSMTWEDATPPTYQ